MQLTTQYPMLLLLISIAAVTNAKPCILESSERRLVRMREAYDTMEANPVNTSAAAGPYGVKFGRIAHVPGLQMGGRTSAVIIYPSAVDDVKDNSTFPLLSFAHATYIGGMFPTTDISYKTLMTTVVSYGFIVVAPETCSSKECFSPFAKDQITTIGACKKDPSLHPALAKASFDKVGVFGHSMGAMATIASAGGSSLGIKPAEHNIVAAVSMHPCQDIYERPTSVSVPIMFTTGSSDTICADGCADRFYKEVSGHKVLLSVSGASHFDPTNRGRNREDKAIGLFFACWVRGEHCDDVYGSSGKAICGQLVDGTTAECQVNGAPAELVTPL